MSHKPSINSQGPQIYDLILRVCHELGVDPLMSFPYQEANTFFDPLLKTYQGKRDFEALEAWLRIKIGQVFLALSERPRWIQSPEWPVIENVPMIFVGQIEITAQNAPQMNLFFHDDTTFYLFIPLNPNPGKPYRVIMQQY